MQYSSKANGQNILGLENSLHTTLSPLGCNLRSDNDEVMGGIFSSWW